MKFKNILFTLIMFIVFMGSIGATEEIATCVYKKDKETVTVKIFTDYAFEVTQDFIDEKNEVENLGGGRTSTTIVKVSNNLQYNYFIDDKTKKFKCADEIYLNKVVTAGGSQSGSRSETNNIFSNVKQEAKAVPGSYGGTYYSESITYKNDKNSSKVNIESPSEADKEEGWLKTCTYGGTIIRFNKETVEFVKKADPTVYSQSALIPNNEPLIDQLKNHEYACPVTLCTTGYSGYGTNMVKYDFYFDHSMSGKNGCVTGAEYSDAKYSCVGVNQYYTAFMDYHNKYQTSKSVNDLNMRNKNRTNLTSFCSSTLANLDYSGNDKCVKECLQVEKEIDNTLNTNINGECGFSGRLLAWISNILRWAKYILPVLVMVLGILDFMKAMGADKEDEMKKAQGRFVKRLIAAALVFLIPLILEFVLDKMGFGYDSCGLF